MGRDLREVMDALPAERRERIERRAAELETEVEGSQCKQLLHIVIGGELSNVGPECVEFRDLSKVEFVGAFPDYESARQAWKARAQATVDNAHMRFFILHAHKLIDPEG